MAQAQKTNPAAATPDEEDFFDDAKAAFPKMEHLAPSVPPKFGPGRLVAIWARSEGTRKNDRGQSYPYVETVTLTLDDGPDGKLDGPGWAEDAATIIPSGIQRLDGFQHSTGGLVARLQKRIKGVNANGQALRNRPMIGRVNTQASSNNKNVAAYSISEPTDEEKAFVRQPEIKAMILAINAELEKADKDAEDSGAFDE